MRIDIKNFSAVREASVKCDGLTVIAGENDTGKSTVGKLIFSIVKAISRFESDFGENKKGKIFGLLKEVYSSLGILKPFSSNIFNNNLEKFYKKTLSNINHYLKDDGVSTEDIRDFIDLVSNEIKILLENTGAENGVLKNEPKLVLELTNHTKSAAISKLHTIYGILLKYQNTSETVKEAFFKALVSEFKMEVSSKTNNEKSIITWTRGNNQILTTSIQNNKITDFNLLNEGLEFDDVTFVESPIILQLFEIIEYADTLFDIGNVENKGEKLERLGRPKVSFHIKDLVNKLKNAQYFFDDDENRVYQLAENIQGIITGKFNFSSGDSDFLFSKETKKGQVFNLKSINTASGIKAFGIIQLLILSGIVDEKSLLVVDEPETHLHPKWQVAYAQILVELVKNDIKVLVTSHSPYFIQAVKYYSKAEGITDKVNYYLAERHDAHSNNIKDVTNDLNQIFIKLSEPLQALVWQQ